MKNYLSKTKGNYLPSSRARTRRNQLLLVVVVLFVLMFGRGMLVHLGDIVFTPIYYLRHYIDTSSALLPVFVRSKEELLTEIRRLNEEIALSKGYDATVTFLTEENKELRRMLGAPEASRIVAGVIARPPYTPYDTVMLDAGSSNGVVTYAPVYTSSTTVIGYTRTVNERSSLVTLFSTPGVESTVYVFGPNIFTTAYGEGGGVVRISIPQGLLVKEGDLVVLPSLEHGALGTIDMVQSIPTEPEQHAYLTFPVPLQSLRMVSVGTRPFGDQSLEGAMHNIQAEGERRFIIDVPQGVPFSVGSTTSSTTDSRAIATSTAQTTP